jgi:L-alanine-DL-glutamate epimerase-like enolase superfamily enzyme
LQIVSPWDRRYQATIYPGRRGLGIHAPSALDIALHDLAGKQPGRSAHPSLADSRTLAEMLNEIGRQLELGLEVAFRAVKIEVLFYDLVIDRELVEIDEDVLSRYRADRLAAI